MAKVPPPPPKQPTPTKRPKLLTLPSRELWRVHAARFRAGQFHPGGSGDARFSPIYRPDKKPISTLYAASTLAGAMMETVLHDVPTPPGSYILDLDKLRELELSVSVIRPKRALKLIDISTKGLQRLGLARTQLADMPVSTYPDTRAWAEWFHANVSVADGLIWTSRRDDEAKTLLLFGDRVKEREFSVVTDRDSLVDARLAELLELAEHIGIDKVIGT